MATLLSKITFQNNALRRMMLTESHQLTLACSVLRGHSCGQIDKTMYVSDRQYNTSADGSGPFTSHHGTDSLLYFVNTAVLLTTHQWIWKVYCMSLVPCFLGFAGVCICFIHVHCNSRQSDHCYFTSRLRS